MARGWESKNVEEQQSEAERAQRLAGRPEPTPDEVARARERDGLKLARARTLSALQAACHPQHRALLERTLQHIDSQLEALGPG